MLIEERLVRIKKAVEKNRSVTINNLSESLNVSKDTVRRDLIKLEKQNVLRRTHGGAVSVNKEAIIFDYEQRSNKLNVIKTKIGQKVADIVTDNSSILFDSSTTVEAAIKELGDKRFYAITNSLTHAKLLAEYKKTTISLLPGKVNKKQLFLYGSDTVKKIEQFCVDYTLLGVFALSENGLFIHTQEESMVKSQMIKQGKIVIALTDHTKIGTTGLFKVCSLSEIDILITDKQPDEKIGKSLESNKVELILVD